MGRNARRREPVYGSFVRDALISAGEGVMRNPIGVGATTAFLVTFSFISANALWYQPHFYKEAFFSTRNTTGRQEIRPATPARTQPVPARSAASVQPTPALPGPITAPAAADPLVQKVQASLARLNLYSGPVDGLTGPQTGQAIAAYQKSVGLPASGHIDGFLLKRLDILDGATPANIPAPSPRPEIDAATTQSVSPDADKSRIIKIQAGLKAFGNDGIELDGMMGPKTTAGVREFQSLFGLPVNGQPDAETYAKMRDVGLIN
ncbi:MAG: peptidoglycan-binding protein [Hyphomicrobiales bacterium]|nr:peptidoglycan-binding protein [Hyphomicrobiales bacterium]